MSQLKIQLSSENHLTYVNEIHEMIRKEASQNNMVEQTKQALRQQLINGDAALAILNKHVKAYVCLELWEHYVEIGALIVDPQHRQKGLATQLVKHISDLAQSKYAERQLIILPNKISSRISLKLGFTPKPKQTMHPEIWSLCNQCQDQINFPNCRCQVMVYGD